ncbi:MAG: hypothetical protein HKO57_03335 [Akkermansiaceae bacterium]|nr:hypothetical protein [Akkermansiaceae bacterium]
MSESPNKRSYLKRLPKNYYQGAAWVHWVMTIDGRRTGWLDPGMHATFRETMLHTLARYRLVCPVYTLMPDHAHVMWCGCALSSDQLIASPFFRRAWSDALRHRGFALQKQPYDHVLLKKERDPHAFEDTCAYIMKNPERAKLVEEWRDWEFGGSLVAGFPRLAPSDERFWPRFWKAYNGMRDQDTL